MWAELPSAVKGVGREAGSIFALFSALLLGYLVSPEGIGAWKFPFPEKVVWEFRHLGIPQALGLSLVVLPGVFTGSTQERLLWVLLAFLPAAAAFGWLTLGGDPIHQQILTLGSFGWTALLLGFQALRGGSRRGFLVFLTILCLLAGVFLEFLTWTPVFWILVMIWVLRLLVTGVKVLAVPVIPRGETPSTAFDFAAYGISSREQDVVRLAALGHTNQEIAQSLFISLSTVKTHFNSLLSKTGSRNRVEMLAKLKNPPSDGGHFL